MTALAARKNPAIRDRVRAAVHCHDSAIKSYLDGWPMRPRLEAALRAALEAEGVDCETRPERTPEEIAEYRRRRNGGPIARESLLAIVAERDRLTVENARLRAELASAREALDVSRSRPAPRDAALHGQIAIRPHVMGGAPCIAGTRIMVATIKALSAEQEWTAERICREYPSLVTADVQAALDYQEVPATASPARPRVVHILDEHDHEMATG